MFESGYRPVSVATLRAAACAASQLLALCLATAAQASTLPQPVDVPLANGDFSEGLADWQVDLAPAPTGPAGDISVVDGAARLLKGGAYRVRLSQAFDAPEGLRAIRLRLASLPQLTASGSFIPDAFDVHLTDARGFTRVASIRSGASAAVNASGSPGSLVLSGGATLQANVLRIAVDAVATGEPLQLSVTLVGPSSETQSSVAIDDVVLEAQAIAPPEAFRIGNCTIFWDAFESGYPAPPQPACYQGQVNDTGVLRCADGSAGGFAGTCPIASAPGQDAEYGRDPLADSGVLAKRGLGDAGFDFSKLDENGLPLPNDAAQWACVVDNTTGLVWEHKSSDPASLRFHGHTYSWFDPDSTRNGGAPGVVDGGVCSGSGCDTEGFVEAVNTEGYCGANVWRLPTRAELMTLIHNGRLAPSIDTGLFPQTPTAGFWTASPVARSAGDAWIIMFSDGNVTTAPASSAQRIRLVRALP